MLDYNTYVWIAQLFILGLIVGYMRDQIRMIRRESLEMEEHLTGQIADLQEINATNVRIKAAMEQQLIGHQDSIGKIYQITSRLEQQMPDIYQELAERRVYINKAMAEEYPLMATASSSAFIYRCARRTAFWIR